MLTFGSVLPNDGAAQQGAHEVIIGLQDQAEADLSEALQGNARQQAGRHGLLFDQVESTRAVWQRGNRPVEAYVLSVADSSRQEALIEQWRGQPGVAFVQRNHTYSLDGIQRTSNDPLLDSLRYREVIQVQEAWDITRGREEVVIGFVDTGLHLEHPDLRGQVWVNPGEDLNGNGRIDESDFNGQDDDGNGYVDDLHGYDFVDRPSAFESGDYARRDADPSPDRNPPARHVLSNSHGTAVAGVLGAALNNGVGIAGVAPGARLLPVRAFGADGRATDDDIAGAIVYAAEMGVDVLNLSFGDVHYSPLMKAALDYAEQRGVVAVASAGNTSFEEPHYPSDYPSVVSVAFLNAEGTGLAPTGTYGQGLDLGAPGAGIFTTSYRPADQTGSETPLYERMSGSSFAAPMAAGTAALLRSVDSTLSPSSIRSALTTTAVDIGRGGWDARTGAGRLNAAAALSHALPARTEITSPALDEGVRTARVPITGTVMHPSFSSFSLEYAEGNADLNEDDWRHVAGPVQRQVLRDTLAVWSTGELPDSVYTLRLTIRLRNGTTLEVRRRVYVDRTPPQMQVHLLHAGLLGARHGVLADVETDDLSEIQMKVHFNGASYTATSPRRARRHGLSWPEESGQGGTARVTLTATNTSGLTTTVEEEVRLPANRIHSSLFADRSLSVPYGHLLTQATDFDDDGLLELTLNRYEQGGIGDTLAVYEWSGDGFRPALKQALRLHVPSADTLDNVPPRAGVVPRDVAEQGGRRELLTQVPLGLVLLRQHEQGQYPFEVAYADTVGHDGRAVTGALLTDLDEDGRREIFVQNVTQWLVLERRGDRFEVVAELPNPTSAEVESPLADRVVGNQASGTVAEAGDFDGDARQEVIVGDEDGDLIVFEGTGDDAFEVTWTHETDHHEAGARMTSGDFDGDGQPEFVTFARSWTDVKREEGPEPPQEVEPPIGYYAFWEGTADDTYTRTALLPIRGGLSQPGALRADDFNQDGRDEIALLHPPHLYVIDVESGSVQAQFHRGVTDPSIPDGMASPSLATGDFDGDGHPEIVAASADGTVHRFVYQEATASTPPPLWGEAFARDDSTVVLRWNGRGADSVTVYAGPQEGAMDPVATTDSSALQLRARETQAYALRGWHAGEASPLAGRRVVRPHPPARVEAVRYPDTASVRLVFSEPLARTTRAAQFELNDGSAPESLLLTQNQEAVILRFEDPPQEPDTLRWTDVRDAEGAPLAQTSTPVRFPEADPPAFVLEDWRFEEEASVQITFSAPLEETQVRNLSNYRLTPAGRIAEVSFGADQPRQVTLRVEGVKLGPTGLPTTLHVSGLRSRSGGQLADGEQAVRLSEAAADLSEVFVFPNPHRASRHADRVMVGGLPAEATIRIFTPNGAVVNTLTEQDGDGGRAWNLRDQEGQRVPAGVYLVRVEAEDEDPVWRRVALVR